MSSIRRYKPVGPDQGFLKIQMYPDTEGGWVSYADYVGIKTLFQIAKDAIGERNAAEHSLNEAVRLLEAYGGGIGEIEEWLKNR